MVGKILLTVAAAIGLSGCIISSGTVYHADDPFQFFSRAALRGPFPVMIVGESFPGHQVEVETTILDALDRNFRSFGNPFRVIPVARGSSSRLIVLFTAASDRPLAVTVCADPTQLRTPVDRTGDLRVGAYYCADGPKSEAWVQLPRPASPDAEDFKKAMDTLIYEALPREPEPSRRLGDLLPPI